MKVIELVIDGFKSYAVRTVISGWDDKFNAITGLNGSGKSNILDAICFVLGITNMSTVRAQNVQELIYKRGQAGVTKASVTIVFDNSDKARSPIGFEEYGQISVTRQIVMGGTTKYLINGHRAQQQTVQNLFQSVGLNVNNPNFLIMQGRITKVLNMKAAEVLAMIEEAAGTRMFEERKDRALKTMAKKDLKLREIQTLLEEEMEPKLEKLRGEKRAFLDFQQAQTEVERLTRAVTAYDWWAGTRKKRQLEADVVTERERRREMAARHEQATAELAALEDEISRVKGVIANEMKHGGIGGLEDQARKASNEAVRAATVVELKRKGLEEGLTRTAAVRTRVQDAVLKVDHANRDLAVVEEKWRVVEADRKKLEREVEEREGLLQTAMTGISEKGGDGMGFEGRVSAAKHRLGELVAAEAQGRKRIEVLAERKESNRPKLAKAEAELTRLEGERARLCADLSAMEQHLGDDGNEADIRTEQASLQDERRTLLAKREELKASAPGVDFAYSDPEPGFDRGRVKGVVAKLFNVPDLGKLGTAVEVCAGGRLWNVVVDCAETGAALLEKGRLTRRVTLIPLDQISAGAAGKDRVDSAKRIAPGRVELALELVTYNSDIHPAMRFLFGSTLVAEDGETAKRVTFDPAVKLRTVTVEGDVYDPAGTLSGGSRVRKNKILDVVAEIVKTEIRIAEIDGRLGQLAVILNRIEQKKGTRKAAEMKRAEVDTLDNQLRTGTAAEVVRLARETDAEMERLAEEMRTRRQERLQAEKSLEQAQAELAEFGKDRGGTLAVLERMVAELKERLRRADREVVAPTEGLRRDALAELELAEAELASAREELESEESALGALESEIAALAEQEEGARKKALELDGRLTEERERVAGHADELSGLEATRRAKGKEKADADLAIKQAEIAIERALKEIAGLTTRIAGLEAEHEWIASEKDGFGKPGGRYDFGDDPRPIAAARQQLSSLLGRFSAMKRRINPKVMNMIDSVEKKEAGLRTMMRTVIRDKKKIEETINSLDEYKRDALSRTWRTVNRDFGAIFGEVLPGSFAKLEPIRETARKKTKDKKRQKKGDDEADEEDEEEERDGDGDEDGQDGAIAGAGRNSEAPQNGDRDGSSTFADALSADPVVDLSAGLAIRVRLGSIWKSSLAELSGGQRSLIALSLILALLQSKPAPMYILDEVDAALDLSHTQNIGTLIRTRFGGAQFVVVSLKDGMWANANRVFRTTFVGGTSVVRTEGGRA